MNCPRNLLPENLPRDFVQAAAVCITIQAFNNVPCHVQDIFDGLYGDMADCDAEPVVREFTALLNKMLHTGLITVPRDDGTVILTDKGDEAATSFRELWEGGGIINISDLIP